MRAADRSGEERQTPAAKSLIDAGGLHMLKTFVSLTAFAAAVPAAAATEALPAEDIVVTATGIEQPRDEVGQAITVIDLDTITRRQSITITDLLITTPGVRINRSGGLGTVTGVSLRGSETTQTLVLIDGVKVNDTSSIGDAFDFGNLLVGNIQRIEILRGSNSIVHGSQAIGGVVNLMTADGSEGFGVTAQGEYGYSDTWNGKAQVTAGSGAFTGSAGLAYFRTDGISAAARSFGGAERDGYENLAANARLKITLSEDVNVDLRGYYIKGDVDYDSFFGTPADSPDVAKSDQYIGYAGLNVALFDGRLKNRFAVTYFKHDRDYFFVRSDTPDYGYTGDNLRFEYQGVAEFSESARLIFGYEHERPEYDFFGFGSTARETANLDSVYALAVVKPIVGLSLTAGVRHDDHNQFGGATTFGANANYSPNGGDTNIRLAYGEGFKAPSLYQLYDSFSGNPDLRPERSKSYDIGVDQSFLDRRVLLSLTLFRRDTRDQIDYSNSTFSYSNLARTRAKGAEATVALKPVNALTVTASYSYVDAEDRSRTSPTFGQRLLRRAANSVSLSADYDWSFGLSTGATITQVSDSYDLFRGARVRLDGYALVDLRASLPLGEHLEAFGRIENLFDADYTTVSGYGTYGRAAYGGVRVRF